MTAYRQTLKHGDTLAVDVAADPVVPPVDPPPSGNQHQATTNAELLALLARKDLGTLPVIVVPAGTVLSPLTFTTAHGGPNAANRTTVRADGAFMDCRGGNSGIAFNGGRFMDVEGLAFRNGNFTQNGIITFGYTGKPAATKSVALRRLSHDATCVGPARASTGTAAATAHFIYVSQARDGEFHDDIVVEDCVGHADDRGLAAMLHLYAGSTPIRHFRASRCTAYGYTQAVMAWAGGLEAGIIEDFNGVDCYTVLRLKYGTGQVLRPKSSHPGPGNHTNPLYEKASGWTVDSVAGLL